MRIDDKADLAFHITNSLYEDGLMTVKQSGTVLDAIISFYEKQEGDTELCE